METILDYEIDDTVEEDVLLEYYKLLRRQIDDINVNSLVKYYNVEFHKTIP